MGLLAGFLEQGLILGRGSLALLRAGLPAETRSAVSERENKLVVFQSFRYPHGALGLNPKVSLPLAAQVARVEDLPPYYRLWTTEGLGHAHAEAWSEARPEYPALLSPRLCGPLPKPRLLALHTGVGLSLARHWMRGGTEDLQRRLPAFADLCLRQARPGYAGALFEALGLMAMTLSPESLEELDQGIWELGTEKVALFWHGAGRGLYFAPSQLLPAAASLVLARVRRLAPHRLGRINALAGLFWAVTLVNLRQPQVLTGLLDRAASFSQDEREGLWHGIGAALSVARDALGDGPLLRPYQGLVPEGISPGRWAEMSSGSRAKEMMFRVLTTGQGGPGRGAREVS